MLVTSPYIMNVHLYNYFSDTLSNPPPLPLSLPFSHLPFENFPFKVKLNDNKIIFKE
jgi:hypothetical protein